MLFIVISMIVIVAVAVLVVAFVAFRHRGEELPGASWLGAPLSRVADALPTIADGDLDRDAGHGNHARR